MSIAGVPGFNDYVSLDLVHAGLTHEQPVLWVVRIAQVITVAALFRAGYLGFLRCRSPPYERFDPPHAGMRISLLGMAGFCVALGVFGHPIVREIAAPAGSTLLHPERYANLALGRTVTRSVPDVRFDYFAPDALLPALFELLLGTLLCVLVLRHPDPAALRPLRRLRTPDR